MHAQHWHSYTDDHRGTLISNIINNSNYITLTTNIPTRVPNTYQQATSLYPRHSTTTPKYLAHKVNTKLRPPSHIHYTKYKLQQQKHSYTNYKKVIWKQYTENTDFSLTTNP